MRKEWLYEQMKYYDTNLEVGRNKIDDALNKFFESNICIPKGENRHPYADVLHEWSEDISKTLQVHHVYHGVWDDLKIKNSEFRIKPSEPVYEWQWEMYYANKQMKTVDYFTDEEVDTNIYSKLNSTKRERQ